MIQTLIQKLCFGKNFKFQSVQNLISGEGMENYSKINKRGGPLIRIPKVVEYVVRKN